MMNLLKKFNDKNERFVRFEYILFFSYIILAIIGYFAIKSSVLNTYRESVSEKQILFIIVGFIIYNFILIIPDRTFKKSIPIFFILSFLSLIAVLFLGTTTYGAKRWIRLGPLGGFQPSEFFKLFLILYLSYILSYKSKKHFYFSSILVIFSAILIYKEPDLGTTFIVLLIWFIFIFLSGKFEFLWKFLFFSGMAAAPVLFFFMKDYQKARIIGFLSPEAYSSGISYNVIQSTRAIGSGGILGRGYMNGYMNLGNFVPENHSDFIISVIGEEFGFIGISLVLFLYLLILLRLYKLYKISYDIFWKYFYIVSAFLLFFHIFENIGMNMGIMPVTGIALPFLSAGGTSTISFSILLGIATKGAMTNKNIKR
jgi:rod shape determining protein RodA